MVYSLEEISFRINQLGQKTDGPKFRFISIFTKKISQNNRHRICKIQCLVTHETKECRYEALKKGVNPFKTQSKMMDKLLTDIVNEIGKKSNPPYQVVDFRLIKNSSGKGYRYFTIKNLQTKEMVEYQYNHLVNGHNPFNHIYNNTEINELHPQVIKIATDLKYEVIKNYRLSPKTIIDLKLAHPELDYHIGVEVKRSDVLWSYSFEQKTTYEQLVQNHALVKKLFFTDPLGNHRKHGFISFKELQVELKQLLVGSSSKKLKFA